MCSGVGDTTQLVPGSPIQTPWDHSSVDSYPRPIAASHVLHRLLVPRHPPCALSNLTTKMLASTVQFSTNTQPAIPPPHNPHPSRCRIVPGPGHHPKKPPAQARGTKPPTRARVVPSGPNRVSTATPSRTPTTPSPPTPTKGGGGYQGPYGPLPVCDYASVSAIEHPTTTPVHRPTPPGRWCGPLTRFHGKVLLRKEVIQPHLPVRLPCYDFVPIASPTFDGSLPQGVRPPASGVADFRDVTGGVYKARERIHRSVADLRLLATPTSRGRVADPDPN